MNTSHPEPFVQPGHSLDPEHSEAQPEAAPLSSRINGEENVLPVQAETVAPEAPPPRPRKQYRRGKKGPFASGRHLAAARTLAGLKQSELADMAGIHVNSLKRLEQMDDIRGSHHSTKRFYDALKQCGVVAESYPATVLRQEQPHDGIVRGDQLSTASTREI